MYIQGYLGLPAPPTSSFSVILAKSKEAGHKEVKVGKFVG